MSLVEWGGCTYNSYNSYNRYNKYNSYNEEGRMKNIVDHEGVIMKAMKKVGGVFVEKNGSGMELVEGEGLATAVRHLRKRVYEARIRRVMWSEEDVEAARAVLGSVVALAEEMAGKKRGESLR